MATETVVKGLTYAVRGDADITVYDAATGGELAKVKAGKVDTFPSFGDKVRIETSGSYQLTALRTFNAAPAGSGGGLSEEALAELGVLTTKNETRIIKEWQTRNDDYYYMCDGVTGGRITFTEEISGVNRIGFLLYGKHEPFRLRLPGGGMADLSLVTEERDAEFWYYFDVEPMTLPADVCEFVFVSGTGEVVGVQLECTPQSNASVVASGCTLHGEFEATLYLPVMKVQQVEGVQTYIPAAPAEIEAAVAPVDKEVQKLTAQTAAANKKVELVAQGSKDFAVDVSIFGGFFIGWKGSSEKINRLSFYVNEVYLDEAQRLKSTDVSLQVDGVEVAVEAVYVEKTTAGVLLRINVAEFELNPHGSVSCFFAQSVRLWIIEGSPEMFLGGKVEIIDHIEDGPCLSHIFEYMQPYDAVAHAADTVAHMTEAEHAGLAELLAKKDELLALLNS